jgi:cytochrome c oxidase cbb3-type subunit 2
MIRPFRAETLRYGPFSKAGEFVYDHPFQWGSKRTGPDLHRVGGKYSDEWHRIHLNNPRDLVPESNMPAYPWLARTGRPGRHGAQDEGAAHRGRALHRRRDRQGGEAVKGKTELEALIAYLQVLGTAASEEGTMDVNDLRVVTVVSLVLFLGIVANTWRRRRRRLR